MEDYGPSRHDLDNLTTDENPYLKAIIGICYLFGTQPLTHPFYSKKKRRKIDKAMDRDPNFLNSKPICVTAIPHENNILLAVNDGHNRIRVARSKKLEFIPAVIYTIEQIANYSDIPEQKVIDTYMEFIEYTNISFNRALREENKPQYCHRPMNQEQWEKLQKTSV